jgi:hypothetical protein
MSDELSPEARTLLQAARDADLPEPEDRARVRARLALLLAGTAAGSVGSKVAAQTAVGGKLGSAAVIGKTLLALAVVGAVGVGASIALRRPDSPPAVAAPRPVGALPGDEAAQDEGAPAPTPAPMAATADVVTATLPVAQPAELRPAAPGGPGRMHSAPERAAPRPGDHDWAADLQAEVALLSLAQRALAAGKPEAALEYLAQHRAQFPKGALSQERRAASAIAHCQAGRLARGRELLEDLPDDSPLSGRAVDACRGTPR